jgi:hypothetical protein
MMDYAATARAALAALKSAGALVTVAWDVSPAYDPSNPDEPATPYSIATYGAMVPYAAHKVGTQPDSLIRAGDRNLLLAATSPDGVALTEPAIGARITAANGETWRVAACEAICPAAETVLFDITARR